MSNKTLTRDVGVTSNIVRWTLGIVIVIICLLNLLLVHPVPGAFCLLLSLV